MGCIYRNVRILFIIAVMGCLSCTHQTTTQVDTQRTVFPNGERMEIEKVNTKTAQYGIITKHHYGDRYRYTYKCTLEKEDIVWDGGSREPKTILFASDTVFFRSLTKKHIPYQAKDTVHQIEEVPSHDEIQEVFEKYVDERYFFNWFGEGYWVTIPRIQYDQQFEKGVHYPIPNDNELTLNHTQ